MFIEWKKYGKPSMLGVATGVIAGLGTITPASGFVGPLGAVFGERLVFPSAFVGRGEDIADIDGVRNVQNNLRVRDRNHRRWTFL